MTDWVLRAACRNVARPGLWFADHTKGEREAAEVCQRDCLVRRQCGRTAAARDEQFGVWAGFRMSQVGERRALRTWLGLDQIPVPAKESRTCSCGRTFTPRLPHAVQCAPCERGFVATAPILEHVRKVQAATGMLRREVAEAAGVSRSAIAELARNDFTSRTTAARLLALPVDQEAVTV